MLRKLLKHEWYATCKVMVAINLALILLTFIGCCILNTDIFNHKDAVPMAILMVILYTLSLTVFGISTLIYLYFRFYRNLFTGEGYLMHTLPVTPMQLFHSKLIIGYLWTLLNTFLIIISVLALTFIAGYHFAETHNAEDSVRLLQGFQTEPLDSNNFANAFFEFFGYTPLQFLFHLTQLQIIGSFVSLLTGYVSILLGQLVEKYKLMASIGFYIILYIVNQIVCSILMILPALRILVQDTDNFLRSYYKDMMEYAIFSQFFMGFVFYFAAVFLMRRRVNLD